MGGTLFILVSVFVAFTTFVFIVRMRRRSAKHAEPPASDPFDLADIHSMLQAGTITADESERLTSLLLKQREGVSEPPDGKRGFDVLHK